MQTTFTIPTNIPNLPTVSFSTTLDQQSALNIGIPVHDNVSNPRFPRVSATPCVCSPPPDPAPSQNNSENFPHVEAFWLPGAKIQPIQIGSWVGSIAKGANVNCDLVEFCPHGCATHTECFAHISGGDAHSILYHTPTAPLPSLIITPTFVPYDNFTASLSPQFPASIPINPQYQLLDTVVGGIAGLASSLATILSRIQNHFKIDQSWDSQDLLKVPHLDLLLPHIPPQLLAVMRLFSKSLIIRTYLPQSIYIYQNLAKSVQSQPTIAEHPDVSSQLNQSALLPIIQSKILAIAHHLPPSSSTLIPQLDLMITNELNKLTLNNANSNSNNMFIIFNNTNPPYIPSQFMYTLCSIFEPDHLIVDLPSVDREDDGGKVFAHKLHFLSSYPNPHSTPQPHDHNNHYRFLHHCPANRVEKRTITELCLFPLQTPTDQATSLGDIVLSDLRTAPIESDATPSMPLLYPVYLH